MAESLQIANMDAKQIAERQIIERYLAGRLSEEDARAFEAYVEVHPEITRNIEAVARMKSGLATLRKRGELTDLLRPRPRVWYRRPGLLAGAAASVVVALLLTARPWNIDANGRLLAATVGELVGKSGSAPAIATRVTLARSRGLKPQIVATQPDGSAVEVTLQLLSADTTTTYSIGLLHMASNSLEPVADATNLRANADGNLVVFVRTELLTEGDYVFRVSTAGREPSEFALRVTREAP